MRVSYEYVAEPTDEYGSIIDPLFGDTLNEVKKFADGFECHGILFALVRNEGDEINGIQERGYAYFNESGELPEHFDCGHSVPLKFIRKHGLANA